MNIKGAHNNHFLHFMTHLEVIGHCVLLFDFWDYRSIFAHMLSNSGEVLCVSDVRSV